MFRQYIFRLFVLIFCLSACAENKPQDKGIVMTAQKFYGMVASDEPRSVLVAKDVLSNGGTAVDAAVAMAFSMAVTYPSRVGILGGGMCQVIDDTKKGNVKTIDFSLTPFENADIAIPSMPRAMFALHNKYGRLNWQELLMPAENMAKFGVRNSAPFMNDINNNTKLGITQKFNAEPNYNLAALITQIRIKGPGVLYSGKIAKDFISNMAELKYKVSADELKSYSPNLYDSFKVEIGNDVYNFPSEDNLLAQMWKNKTDDNVIGNKNEAGFVVADYWGAAVACNFTIGDIFGSKKYAGKLGAIPAKFKPSNNIVNVIVNNKHNKTFRFALISSGEDSISQAYNVIGNYSDIKNNLNIYDANLIACPEGLPEAPDVCSVISLPENMGIAKYFGLADERRNLEYKGRRGIERMPAGDKVIGR